MQKSRFTEEQIIGILKEADQGKTLKIYFDFINNADWPFWLKPNKIKEIKNLPVRS